MIELRQPSFDVFLVGPAQGVSYRGLRLLGLRLGLGVGIFVRLEAQRFGFWKGRGAIVRRYDAQGSRSTVLGSSKEGMDTHLEIKNDPELRTRSPGQKMHAYPQAHTGRPVKTRESRAPSTHKEKPNKCDSRLSV